MKYTRQYIILCVSMSLVVARVFAQGTTSSVPAAPVQAVGSLWATSNVSMFTPKLFAVGDLITVNVVQQSSTAQTAKHTTSKDVNATLSPGIGIFAGIPAFGAKASRGTNGAGNSAATTQVTDRLTVTVTRILPSGNLAIEGTRTIKLENDEMLVTFNGEVRPLDIQPDNTVASELVANQKLTTKGMGPISDKSKPGWFSRLLQFLW